MRRLFGTDGIRGIANEDLGCERAMQIGRALGTVLSSHQRYRPTVLIGCDTRISSDMLTSAISAGLCSVGSNATLLGVMPTPAVAYLIKKYGAKAGVVISASHNPYNYNGIKIFGEDGFKLSDELEERIESIVLDNTPPCRPAPPDKIGRVSRLECGVDDYVSYLLATQSTPLDGMKIAIDCSNGAASVTAEKLFSRTGATIKLISELSNGININDGCGSTNLEALKKLVKEGGFDVGIAFDGDADRCIAVDEQGGEVDGDFIMAIIAQRLKRDGELKKNTVVGTVMTNYGFTKFCEENGIGFVASKVGDRFVMEILNQEGYSLGGEQSGHIIMRKHATTGDGQLTALTLLSILKSGDLKLSEACRCLKKYPQYTVNLEATEEEKLALFTDGDVREIIRSAEKKLEDKGRLVIRPSGTEPVIRIMAEGENEEETKTVANDIAKKIKSKLRGYLKCAE